MKLFNIVFLICLSYVFIVSCNLKQEEVPKEEVKKKIQIVELKDKISDSIVDSDFPKKSFKFNLDSTRNMLNSIYVYSDSKCIQKITTKKEIESIHFELIDWNFDGHKDISVLSNCGSGGCAYWIWNYIPKSDTYEYNKELSEVLGLEMDSKQKQIIFHYRFGYQDEYWKYYEYKDNKLVYIKEISN